MLYEIYLIEGPGCWYVGSTKIGAQKRFHQHMRGEGHSPRLAQKVAKLGPNAFTLTILDGNAEDRLDAERYWYDCLLDEHTGCTLNSHRPGSYPEPTPERNAKLSDAHRGKVLTPEHRAKISLTQTGKKRSSAAIAKTTAANMGKKRTLEFCRANAERQKGKPVKANATIWTCVCGRSFNPGNLARHRKATGHVQAQSNP